MKIVFLIVVLLLAHPLAGWLFSRRFTPAESVIAFLGYIALAIWVMVWGLTISAE